VYAAPVPTITKDMLAALEAAGPGAPEKTLEDSGPLDGKSLEEVAPIQKRMLTRLAEHAAEVTAVLGEPNRDTDAIRLWYPEVVAAYGWGDEDGIFALSAVHPTANAPITLTLRYLTRAEVLERA
jgi:hypothetical protein